MGWRRAEGTLSAESIDAADRGSPLTRRSRFSGLADPDELAYREEIERYDDPPSDVVRFIEGKRLPQTLDSALDVAGLKPRGTIVELGAGTCWLSAMLAKRPDVDRVIAIEFSARRIAGLAPIALAYLGAPPRKVQRVIGDFYEHGLEPGAADFVFTDASFHHAADPAKLSRVAFDLLRPGGYVVLLREPTLSLLRRTRDHGEEGRHGSFEHEYFAREYVSFLTDAGFEARKLPVSYGTSSLDRLAAAPPLSWLNGVLFSRFLYVGRKARPRHVGA